MRNHGGNEEWQPAVVFRPGNDVDQLSDLMQFLSRAGARMVKAGGSRHSWSPAAASSEVYIEPQGMGFVTAVTEDKREMAVLRPDFEAPPQDCFLVGSGTSIRELNDALWAHGKALPVLGGFDGQTLAGVVQTATHGSILRLGAIAGVVQAINLVDAQGRKWRLERANGPSRPPAYERDYPGWTLKQDTDLFEAALVSVGTFGVVHSYLISARDAFHLTEKRTLMRLKQLRALLERGNIYRLMDVEPPPWTEPDDGRRLEGHPANALHLEFLINPHPTGDGDYTAVVTSRDVLELQGEEPPEFARTRSDAKNLFRVLGQRSRFSRPAFSTWIAEHVPWLLARIPDKLMEVFPGGIPYLLDLGLRSMADEDFEGRSYNVFNIGQGQNSIPALSSAPSVPLRDDLYLDALDLILRKAAESAARGRYHTGPISIRFVAGSGAMLADPEDVFRFEIIFTEATGYAIELMRAYEDALYERFGGNVRPHWGQINNLTTSAARHRLAAMYPRFGAWQDLRRDFDPHGVFLNDWQRMLFAD